MEFFKIFIISLAVFLRFYRLEENFGFQGELGDNLLAVKNAIVNRQVPLLGPPTSHPWLYFGPLYYWLMTPLVMIFNFNPVVSAYTGAVAGILAVIFNFMVTRKVFSRKVAYFSSFLMAISPLFVGFSRSGRFMFLVTVLFYPCLWCLYQIWQQKMQFLFWLGLVFGIMFNFHLTPIILVPVILMILWQKKKSLKMKDLWLGLFGFLIPNLPFLIYDVTHGFMMTTKFLIWMPYRFAGFLGLYPKNNLTREVAKQTLGEFYQFISSSFVSEKGGMGVLLAVVVIIFFLLKFKRDGFGWFFLGWTSIFSFVALFIHTNPPIHYFVPILPFPIIIFSLFLEQLWAKSWGKLGVFFLLLTISFLNLRFFFSPKYFYKPQDPSLSLQKGVVRLIIEDAQGQPFNLARVGPFDYFEGDFAQNYRYLAWWLGNEPTEEKTKLRYTIYEDQAEIPEELPEGAELFQIAKMAILKEEK